MEKQLKLYMVMLGCTPKGRLTEQHDIFFGIGSSLKELGSQMKIFWSEAKGKIHIDAWRKITPRNEAHIISGQSLCFINLGGYKKGDFEEYHYKIATVAKNLDTAIRKAKTTTFYKHCGFVGAGVSHIDDKYGIDVDDIHNVNDILEAVYKEKYSLKITKSNKVLEEDPLHIGYLKIKALTI